MGRRLREGLFWLDYYLQDIWMRTALKKLFREDADFTRGEAFLQKRMLHYCKKAYPDYYRYYSLDGSEGLENYPVIGKKDMQDHPGMFATKYTEWISVHAATTGGSTGTPFGFRISPNHDPVHQELLWNYMGYKKGDKIVCINGVALPQDKVDNHIFYDILSPTQLPYGGYSLSCLYLTEESAGYYFAFLEKIRPAFLRGYTSAVYRLAQYAQQHDLTLGFRLKGVQLTSETTFAYQIDYIEKVFQTKVYLQYGHTEAAVFACTYDESHRYRCSPLYGHVEVLNEQGEHVKEGETGEVVVTSYSNFAMPFLRYRTGDLAEYGGTKGGVVTLNKVWGRTQDIIYTKSGEKVFLTALIFGLHYKAFSNIRKWKIIQKTYGEVEFLIVKGPEYSAKDEEELRESFHRHADIGVGFQYVSDIALTRAGKSMFLEQYLEER